MYHTHSATSQRIFTSMRIINLSVDGIHQAVERDLLTWLADQDAEIICLQDLRASEPAVFNIPGFEIEGYHTYVLDSQHKGVRGVAIYTKSQPKALMYGFGLSNGMDVDGRYLQADFETISIGCLLAPEGTAGEKSQEQKDQFFADFQGYLNKITNKRRRYIICGNWQIAHTHIDVENSDNHDQESGFLLSEQMWLDQLYTQIGYADAFRLANTDRDEFSWWPGGDIEQGDGMRTDYQVISKSLAPTVEYAVIYTAKHFSSHAPVIIDYDLEIE